LCARILPPNGPERRAPNVPGGAFHVLPPATPSATDTLHAARRAGIHCSDLHFAAVVGSSVRGWAGNARAHRGAAQPPVALRQYRDRRHAPAGSFDVMSATAAVNAGFAETSRPCWRGS
jgi:hypothetical protein